MLVSVAKVSDVKEGEGKVVKIGEDEIALFKIDGKISAIENTCPHKGGPLGEGMLEGDIVTCPWHHWKFNVKTGVSPVNPSVKVNEYKVVVEGDDVKVDV